MSQTTAPLGQLKPGDAGTIAALDDTKPVAERLRELGFAEAIGIEVLHSGPVGGDPIAVKVGAMTVALRRSDANAVMVETR